MKVLWSEGKTVRHRTFADSERNAAKKFVRGLLVQKSQVVVKDRSEATSGIRFLLLSGASSKK